MKTLRFFEHPVCTEPSEPSHKRSPQSKPPKRDSRDFSEVTPPPRPFPALARMIHHAFTLPVLLQASCMTSSPSSCWRTTPRELPQIFHAPYCTGREHLHPQLWMGGSGGSGESGSPAGSEILPRPCVPFLTRTLKQPKAHRPPDFHSLPTQYVYV